MSGFPPPAGGDGAGGDADRTETLSDSGSALFDSLAEEFAQRCRAGETPAIGEYEARYPEHAERIRALLSTVAMMEQIKRGTPRAGVAEAAWLAPARLGEFRVVREIGRGGMGVVYEAVQESLGREVALKVIHHVHLDAKRLERFRREAQAIARLHHTNIVPIFAFGEHAGVPYYAMQYIRGRGLDALIGSCRREGSPRDAERRRLAARVGVEAAEALQYAHEQGVLHRDIKPANLLLDEHGAVWITDFGLAKLAGQDDLTASGDVIGTLRYLAPEALRGQADARGDVYSLGLTLYELLTLNPPFGELLTPSELLRHVSEREPTRPRRLDPDMPRDLETIILKATAREPAARYPSAAALADDLRSYLEDRPIRARRTGAFERTWRWARRNPATAALGATAAGAVVLAAVVGWVGYMSTMRALENESRRLGESQVATRRAEANVALSLEVFAELFSRLSTRDSLPPPPLGKSARQSHQRPGGGHPPPGDEGPGSFRGGGGPPPPPGDAERPPPPPGAFDGRFGLEAGPPGEGPGPMGPPPGRRRPRGNASEDTALLRSVLSFYDRFARQNATDPKLQGEAAWAYRKVGALNEELGRDADAEAAYARAIEILEGLASRFPHSAEYRFKLVDTYDMADPWSADPGSLERVNGRLRRAQVLIDQLCAERPGEVEYALARLHIYAKLGACSQRLGRAAEAEAYYRRAIALDGELIGRLPGRARPRMDRAITREALASLLLELGRRPEAREQLDAAVEDLGALDRQGGMRAPPDHFDRLAESYRALGEPARAEAMERAAAARPREDHHGPPGGHGHGHPPDAPQDPD